MRTSLGQLKSLLNTNVCEVKFLRRIPIANRSPYRRCLCTTSKQLLESTDGRITLNFSPARGVLPYNPERLGLLVVWDIFMSDYRQVNCRACDLVNTIPIKDFWKYFKEKLAPMSAPEKATFMDL